MKKILAVVLAVMMAGTVFSACAKQEEASPSTQPTVITATKTPAPTTKPSPTPEPTPTVPTDISPTTGLPGNTVYKPIMVQIDNASSARPQTNISLADIVYETDIDGYDTRLSALYNDAINSADAPSELIVGPVRSSRYYCQWIQGEWDALYVHNGGPDTTAHEEIDIWGASAEHIKQRINGAGKHAVNEDLFFALRKGHPLSAYAGIDLMKALAIYDYEPEAKQSFTFYPLKDYASDGQQLGTIALAFNGKSTFVTYQYDEAQDKLLRSMNGKEFKDEATGEQVTVQNLVVQFVNDSSAGKGEGDRRKVDVSGEGSALFVIHGKLMKGKWSRPTYDDKTTYTLDSGEEVTFAPGNTWIEMHPNGKDVTLTYADGSDEKLTGD